MTQVKSFGRHWMSLARIRQKRRRIGFASKEFRTILYNSMLYADGAVISSSCDLGASLGANV